MILEFVQNISLMYCTSTRRSSLLSLQFPERRAYAEALSHSNLVCRDTRHENQRVVRQHPRGTVVPALAALLAAVCVTNSVHNPVDAPDCAQNGSSHRPSEARDQECANDGGVVLAEVLVGALGRVERQHGLLARGSCGLDLLVRGVFEGVRDLGCLAEGTNTAAVPGTDEEGADDGAEDIAGSSQSMFGGALQW